MLGYSRDGFVVISLSCCEQAANCGNTGIASATLTSDKLEFARRLLVIGLRVFGSISETLLGS